MASSSLADKLRAQRDEILSIAAKHGAQHVRIFGSVARSEADEKSDIDMLVDLDAGRSLFDQAALMLELANLLDCQVDVLTERGLRSHMRERVLREAMPL